MLLFILDKRDLLVIYFFFFYLTSFGEINPAINLTVKIKMLMTSPHTTSTKIGRSTIFTLPKGFHQHMMPSGTNKKVAYLQGQKKKKKILKD